MMKLVEAVLGTALLFGVFQSGYSVRFDVKNNGTTCILADLSIDFSVDYKKSDGKQAVGSFQLPDTAVMSSISACGKDVAAPLLYITFGSGYSLSLNFSKTENEYHIDTLLFTYNLSDATTFPQSAENGTKQALTNKTEISAQNNQSYKCFNPHLIVMGNVNATFRNVKLEAYFSGSNYSTNVTTCKEDVSPTPRPTSRPTPKPTSAPVKPTDPEARDYKVNGNVSGTFCLWAHVGLQLNITYLNKTDQNVTSVFNIDPKNVNFTGSCTKNYADLLIYSEEVYLLFNFTLNSTDFTFFLGQVHLNTTVLDAKDPKFNADNGSLNYLQTTKNKSYKCDKKQTLQITDSFSINTFNLQVQAFDVDGNKFGPALECSADENGMLVPIIVGAALAGLVLIVLIAYLIGRKRSHAGYQTI